jgi:hypothetical protein
VIGDGESGTIANWARLETVPLVLITLGYKYLPETQAGITFAVKLG